MKRYLVSVAVILLLILGSVAAFNFLIDPLLLFHHRDAGAEQLSRIDQFHNMRLYKPYHVNRLQPDAIIIGSSRTGTIRPNHPSWRGLTGYNFSVPGMTMYELSRSVRHAHANRPLRKLMIGLDYNTLVSPDPLYRPGFAPARMARSPADFYSAAFNKQRIQDLQGTLFSFDMMGESLLAVTRTSPGIRRYYPDGAWRALSKQLTGRGGYTYVATNALTARTGAAPDSSDNLLILRDLLEFCYRNNIEARLFFTPTHVFFVDLWFHLASRQLWRSTHQNIVVMNTALAAQYGRSPFAIRGFGNEQQVVDEPLYRTRDIEKAWFNDGVHYRTRLAERIMAALWDPDEDFGQSLDTANIGEYLDSVEALSRHFVESNKQLVDDLHKKIGLEL